MEFFVNKNNINVRYHLSWESLDSKEIQPVHPKGNQPWIFTGKIDAEAEAPILWPLDAKGWIIGKAPNAGKDWGQEEKWTTEDEMVGWHYGLDGHEFEQALGVGDGQGGLVCCGSLGCKESDTTEQLNWTDLSIIYLFNLIVHFLYLTFVCSTNLKPFFTIVTSNISSVLFSLFLLEF